jgi:hypothetical protein
VGQPNKAESAVLGYGASSVAMKANVFFNMNSALVCVQQPLVQTLICTMALFAQLKAAQSKLLNP